jgi:hypothetical protein
MSIPRRMPWSSRSTKRARSKRSIAPKSQHFSKTKNDRMKGHGDTVSETHYHPLTSTEDGPLNDAGLKSAPLRAVTPEDIKAVVSGRST